MNLTQMQDIAGCRIVFENREIMNDFYKKYYLKGDIKHKLKKTNNYVENPKNDGYKSLHLVYEYKSDKENKKIYDKLLIEIQFRTKIQHIWATSVEMVDFFTRQNLKLQDGDKNWGIFFKLVSEAFSNLENSERINEKTIQKIYNLEKKLNVIIMMKEWISKFKLIDNYFSKLKTKKKKRRIFFYLNLI